MFSARVADNNPLFTTGKCPDGRGIQRNDARLYLDLQRRGGCKKLNLRRNNRPCPILSRKVQTPILASLNRSRIATRRPIGSLFRAAPTSFTALCVLRR